MLCHILGSRQLKAGKNIEEDMKILMENRVISKVNILALWFFLRPQGIFHE